MDPIDFRFYCFIAFIAVFLAIGIVWGWHAKTWLCARPCRWRRTVLLASSILVFSYVLMIAYNQLEIRVDMAHERKQYAQTHVIKPDVRFGVLIRGWSITSSSLNVKRGPFSSQYYYTWSDEILRSLRFSALAVGVGALTLGFRFLVGNKHA